MAIFVNSDRYTSLLVVGNGFDCSLGAMTHYEDFYTFLLKAYNSNSFDAFANDIDDTFDKTVLKSFYDIVKQESEANYFVNYFVLYNKAFNCWVDFESELERIIVSFDDLVSALKDSNKLDYRQPDLFVLVKDNINLMSVLLNYPNNPYFKSNSWGRGEYYFKIKGSTYRDEKVTMNELDKFVKEFPKSLYKDLSSFSKIFVKYLSIIKDKASFTKSHPYFKECGVAINYNYTNFLEHYCLRNDCDLKSILYINGKCDFDNCDDRIVFGIDSNTIIKNKEFFAFTKTAQRSIKNTDIKKLSAFLDYWYFNRIIIYGHSLSVADKESLRIILKKSKRVNDNDFKIIVYCYDQEAKLSIISNLKEILDLDYLTNLQSSDKIDLVDIV